MMPTNPNGANQYVMDPRQKLCWESYANPNSPTFGNALQSALKAGYEEVTARQITGFPWFKEKQIRNNLLSKAEKVLDDCLELDVMDDKGNRDNGAWKIKQDTAKFIAQARGKAEGYEDENKQTVDSLTQILNALALATSNRTSPNRTLSTVQGRPGETFHSDEGSADDLRGDPNEAAS